MKKQPFGLYLLLFCVLQLRGQEVTSVVRLNSGGKVTNAIIYGNSEYKPLSEGVLGYFSASDSVISGTGNIHLTDNPFVNLFRIDANSPAFNSGTTDGLRISDTLDLDGNPRESCCGIDMGSFEHLESPTAIIRQPQPIRTVQGAQPVLLTVAVDGAKLRYQWLQNKVDLFEQTSDTLQLNGQWTDTGFYQVMVFGQCCDDKSVEVRVVYDPWTLESGGECPEEESWAKVWVGGLGYTFLWCTGSRNDIIRDFEAGDYSVKITDNDGRTLVLNDYFYSYLPIEIKESIVEPDNYTCDNGAILITVSDNYTYGFEWRHNGIFYSSTQNLAQNVPEGIYQLTVERLAKHLCPPVTFDFTLNCQYKFPVSALSTFLSPNGDGRNDYLDIKYIERFPNNTVTVIDSKGELIFSAKGYNNKDVIWDGRNRRGQLVPDGTYYYMVKVEGYRVVSGWVMVKNSK